MLLNPKVPVSAQFCRDLHPLGAKITDQLTTVNGDLRSISRGLRARLATGTASVGGVGDFRRVELIIETIVACAYKSGCAKADRAYRLLGH